MSDGPRQYPLLLTFTSNQRMRFSRAGLAVGKDADIFAVADRVDQGTDLQVNLILSRVRLVDEVEIVALLDHSGP